MAIDKASAERVAEIISKENVRFVNLQFTDLMGIVKQITISVEHWSTAVDHGSGSTGPRSRALLASSLASGN